MQLLLLTFYFGFMLFFFLLLFVCFEIGSRGPKLASKLFIRQDQGRLAALFPSASPSLHFQLIGSN